MTVPLSAERRAETSDLSEAISRLSAHITLPDKTPVYVRDVSLVLQAAKECAGLRAELSDYKTAAETEAALFDEANQSVAELSEKIDRLTACLNSIYPSIAGRASVLRGTGETNAAAEWCAVADKIVAALATPQPEASDG